VTPTDRFLLAGAGVALLAGAAAAWLLAAGAMAAVPATSLLEPVAAASPTPIERPAPDPLEDLVVDVEGAVVRPGIQRLPAGARVADAIAAAGGYSADADLDAAARQLNLAQPLSDGLQIYVAPLGAEQPSTAGASAADRGDDAPAGPINVNTATPEQLNALPGVGPVTVQKIVAGRQERPFASLEEMVERKVINRGQLDKIRDLAVAS
jgi:competence protein ComEA